MLKILYFFLLTVLIACSSDSKLGQKLLADIPIQTDNPLIPNTYKSGELMAICEAAINQAQVRLDAIASIEPQKRNIDNTLMAAEKTLADFEQVTNPLYFMKEVHTDKALREEALKCVEKINPFLVKTSTRRDLYNAIKDQKASNPAQKHLLTETLKSFEQSGLKLSDKKLAEFKSIMTKLSNLETKFRTNISSDNRTVTFSASELKGAPSSLMERLKKDSSGKYILTMAYPDYFGVMQNVVVADTRKKMASAFLSRGTPKNVPILEEVLALRQEAAELLGFKTWADYKTAHGRMATNAKMVWSFLNGLKGKLKQGARRDLAGLAKFKKEIEPNGGPVKFWDTRFLEHQYKKTKFDIDEEKIREYFPSERVVQRMFDIYSKLLGVRYEQVFGVKVWSPDVQLYKTIDKNTGKVLSYFYTDFIPREGKYSHAAAFQLRSGRVLPSGQYLKPVSAIVANFQPPSKDKPSLLSHDEVETLFHEFGHIMHQTLTKAPYASLSGTNVARDFVEAPSQMLEEWVWSPKMLSTLSGHYKNPKKKLPKAMIRKMTKARDYNQAFFYTRQLWLGTVDMAYHSNPGKINTTKVQKDLYKEIVGLDPIEDSAFEAGFGHLMGYDAGYYGYIWSKVYALDMFTRFEKAGLLNSRAGMSYRRNILEPGGMKPELDMVKAFLGRSPSPKPFYEKLGI